MKTAVVYYSMSGNTRQTAEKIAEKLGADLIRIEPVREYPSKGFRKFLWGGKSAVMGESPVLEPYSVKVGDYDTVILGTPVWASRCAPPLRSFLTQQSLVGKRVFAFACAAGKSAGKTFDQLEELCGVKLSASELFTDPASGRDPMKDEKLKAFIQKIK